MLPNMHQDLLAEALIEVRSATVRHNGHATLDGVDLSVHAGEIVTLIGPNGSGKTTLIEVTLGLLDADSGTIYRKSGLQIGYMPQHLVVDHTLPLTVRKFLSLGPATAAAELNEILAEVGIEYLLDKPFQSLLTQCTTRGMTE